MHRIFGPWREKRLNCIATTLMVTDVLVPLSLVHGKNIDDAVWKNWWWDNQNFIIYSNDILCPTREIFMWNVREFCWTNSPSFHFERVPTIVLWNNCPAFTDSEILTLFPSYKIR
jgi:hypothetical protein